MTAEKKMKISNDVCELTEKLLKFL
jgi:hypothetical protein